MQPLGIFLIVAALLAPLPLFVELAAVYKPGAVLSQYLGVLALVAMSITQLLATRLRVLEPVFGPVDRMYVLHKWLGIGALAAIVLHDAIGAEIKTGVLSAPFGKLGDDVGEELGEFAYYAIASLIGLTLLTLIPYRWWYWTHRLMGACYVVGAVHFVLMRKPFALGDALGLYVLGCIGIGVVSWLYCLLPIGRSLGRYAYKVRSVEPAGEAFAVTIERERAGIRHRAGQFAFVSFDIPGLSETHPFTISSAPESGNRMLRFTIKPLGDYTRRLASSARPGQIVRVSGPYGRFLRRPGAKAEVWIAGGIGVTPFVAWAGALSDREPPIKLLYCVRKQAQPAHVGELEAAARRNPAFSLEIVDTSKGPRLTAGQVAEAAGVPIRDVQVFFCGPAGMRDELREGLLALGLPRRQFHHEEFEIRTGVGQEKLIARWLPSRRPDGERRLPTTAHMPR